MGQYPSLGCDVGSASLARRPLVVSAAGEVPAERFDEKQAEPRDLMRSGISAFFGNCCVFNFAISPLPEEIDGLQ